MAFLQRGQKSSVFVTHVEFVVSRCEIFCQVGNVGGQADTIAERVAEIIENGSASSLVQYNVGDLVLALFQVDNSWYRGRVLQTSGHSVKVYFIDYGNTEIVNMKNVLRAPEFVLSIPALSTKCIVIDCTPLGSVWTEVEKKKIETMLHSGEFTIEVIDIGPDPNNLLYFVKLYNLDTPNTPIFVRPAANASQSIDFQNLEIGKEYAVFVCYVESVKKFWVQLNSQSSELESLMGDVSVCFAEDLPSSGDLMNPGKGQVCAACFSEDGAFYRGIVQDVHADSCTVFFVDYGNCEKKSTAELFTLPQPLCKLPMQAVACSYNAKGDCNIIEEKLNELSTADKPSVMTVVSGSGAVGYTVTINSIERFISTIKPLNQQAKSLTLWHTYSSLPMQVDAIYDVCLSHVNHPGYFYVQLLENVNYIDKFMQEIYEVAHSGEKLSTFQQGYPCLAKFCDESWYRGEVRATESNKISVVAVDFGFVEQVSSSQLRNNSNFKDQPAQAILCSLDLNKCDENNWSSDDIAKFLVMAEKKALVAKVSAKKGFVYQLDLYDPQNKDLHINKEFQQEKVSLSTKKVLGTQQPLIKPLQLQSIILPPPEVSVGSTLVLCFTALKFPYIYGQVTHTQVDKVAKLQADLNDYFDNSKHNSVTDLSIGSFCCTQYVDEGWYRGMVTSVAGNKFEITFIDFGDCIQKAANDLKVLPSNLCMLPQQCLLCKIDNIPSSVPPSQVESILLNNKVEVHITRKEDAVFPTYSGNIVDRHILDKLLNKSVSRAAFQPATTSKLCQQDHQNERNQCKDLTQQKSLADAYSYQEVSVGSTQKVMVTHVKDPGSFQVVLDVMSGSLDNLMDELEGYYSKLAPGGEQLENARLGQTCVSQFTEDKGWYRALITGIKSNGQIEVLYVDYGNNEYLELESLKVIKPKFTSLPAQAIHCCLEGVTSSFGFWSPECAVQFSEMVEEQSFKATFISIIREQGQLIYKVELVNQKGININKKFGTMTNTLNVATSNNPTSKPFAASMFGQNMTVAIGGEADKKSGFGDQSKSFSGSSKPSFGSGRASVDSGKSFGDLKFDNGCWEEQNGNDSGTSTGFSNNSLFRNNGGGGFGSAGMTDVNSGASGIGRSFGGGSSGGSRDCFKCGQSGHFSRDCPNASSRGGGGGGRDCFKCGESGHMARDCTNPPKDGDSSRKGNQDGFGGGAFSGRSSRSFTQNSKTEASEDRGNTSQSGGFRNNDFDTVKTGGGGFGAKSRGEFGAKSSGAKKDIVGFGSRNDGGDFRKNVSEDEKDISVTAGNRNGRGVACRLGVQVGGCGNSRAESGKELDTDVSFNSSKALVPQQSIGVYSATLLDLVGSVDVYVVFTDDPEHFWCQLIKNCSSLEQLMENMNSFYNKLPNGELTIDRPQTGMPCAAKFSEDNQWYRAKILNSSQQKVEVLFVDYGNSESIFTSKLRHLKSNFMELEMQGIKCSLNCVKPTNRKWTSEAKRDFEDLTHDRHLVAKIISTKPDMTYLLDLENDENTNVREAMIEKGHCSLVDEKISTGVDLVAKDPYLYEMIATGQDIDVRVSWVENPEKFWIQPVSEEGNIYQLVDKIQELYTSDVSAELKAEAFSPGEAVVSLFSDDGAWYRGYIKKNIGDKCIVQFVDYGNSDCVSKESVRLCTEDLMKEPAHAALCKLPGVRPLQSDLWTTDAKDIMDNLVKDNVMRCTVLDSINGQLIVDLVCSGKSIRHELIQAAVVKPEKELSPPVSDKLNKQVMLQKSLQYRNTIDLLVGAVENVYVTHTDSVASFWCQLANHTSQLEELMDELGKFCKSAKGLVDFNNNMACGAKFRVDGSWYRSKVTAIYPDDVEVLFVDYGNTEKVPKEDICYLNKELVELAPQAFQCELQGSNKASNEMVAKFTELIGEEMVQATVLDIIDDVASVQISLSDGKVVAEELGLIAHSSMPKALIPKSIPKSVPIAAAVPSILDIVYPEPSLPSDSFSVYVAHIVNPDYFYIQRVDQEESLNELMNKVTEFCETATAVVGNVKLGRAYCCKFSEDELWYRSKVTKIEGHAITVEFVDYGNSETTTVENIRNISVELAKTAPFAVHCCLSGIKPKEGSWSNSDITIFEKLALEKELTCRVVKLNEVDLVFGDVSIADSLVEKNFAVNCMDIQTKCINSYKFLQQTMPSEALNVVVSYMNSPSDFFIQRVDQEEQLLKLMAKLESDCGGFECLTPGAVSEGQAVCSKYSEDESWYRAEVLKADFHSLTVLYVDYGNSEERTWDNVRNITEELVQSPKFAVNCSLAEVKCHQGKWSDEAIKYFEDITAVKTLLCTFVTPQSIKLIDDGINLIEELLKIEKYVLREDSPTHGQYAIQSVASDLVSCLVSHVEETGTLYLQLVDEEDKLSSIVEHIQELESREPLDKANVIQGQALCARFLEDNSWYRAVVESVDNTMVFVRFVDFGNSATVDQSDLRALSEEYLSIPPLSYPCRLPGFETFNSDQVEILKDESSVIHLTVKFLTSVPEYQIQLYIDDLDVTDILKTTGNHIGGVGENMELQRGPLGTDEETLDANIELVKESSDVDLESIASSVTELKFEDVLLEQRVEVVISHAESPSKFWVQLANNKQILDDLLNTMFEFYDVCADKRLLVNDVSKDMVVAVKYIDDESWYRARVISFDNNSVLVLFVDYGNMEMVGLEFLRKLPATFCMLPVQAIECCLANVQPSSNEWTEDSKVTFKELTENRLQLMDVCGVDDAGVHIVQLHDMGTSVSDLLIQKDVGVQVTSPVALSTKIKQVFTPDSADDVIAKLYDAKASKVIGPYRYNLRDLAVSDSTGFVKNVVVTTVTNPTNFWCRLQDNCYEYYQDKLQDMYSESKELLENLNTESKCVVCTENDAYQRATITEKLQDDKVKVKLVDIGTDAIISALGVWKLKPECELYPQLAFPCTIPGLLPAYSDQWSEKDCQQFREILLELNQQSDLPVSAKATIVSEQDGLVLVELEVDRKDIADSLAERGIANVEESQIETTFNDTFAIDRSVLDEFGTFRSVALEPDSDYTVILSDCDDLDRLVFHTKNGLEVIEEVTQLIVEYVADKVGGNGLPEILQGPCLMQCTDDDLWYRANVKCFGESDDHACQAFLVDYGTTFFIPKTRLLPIPDELMMYPAQAIICCLGEIEPVEENWSESCHTFFREQFMVVEGQAEMLIYVNSYCKGLHEVILHANHLNNKSANHILVEHGLAVPALGSQIELSFMETRLETSFHELSMSKQDSFGENSDVDDTSYEPDTSCLSELDTSRFTERDIISFTEGDTTQFTEGNTTPFTDGDTTQSYERDNTAQLEGNSFCLNAGNSQGNISCIQDYSTTCSIDVKTSYSTVDTSESYASYITTGESSQLPDQDISCLNENDTRLPEGDELPLNRCDTSLFTEGDSACLIEDNISRSADGVTNVDISRSTGDTSTRSAGDTSCVSENDTSQITESVMCIDTTDNYSFILESSDISYIDVITKSSVSAIDTSDITNSETSELVENETSSYTTDESSCYKNSNVEKGPDMSLNTPDVTYWVCEDCEAENLVENGITECIHCQKDRNEYELVVAQNNMIKDFIALCDEMEGHGIDIIMDSNDISCAEMALKPSLNIQGVTKMSGFEFTEMKACDNEKNDMQKINLNAQNYPETSWIVELCGDYTSDSFEKYRYSSTDVDPRSKENSDTNAGWYQECHSSSYIAELELTDSNIVDKKIESVNVYSTDIEDANDHAICNCLQENEINDKIDLSNNLEPDIFNQDETVLLLIDKEDEQEDINGLEKEECILEPGIKCIIEISDVVNKRENKDFVIDRPELQAFPSISNTTNQSTLTSVSDFSFTINYDSSQTDSIFVYEDSKHSLESKGECYKSGESDLQKDLITDDNISNNLVVCDQKSSDGINEKSLNQERKYALEMTHDVCECSQVILNIEKDSIPDKVKEMQCSVSEVETGQYTDTLYLGGIDEKGIHAPVRAKPEDIVKEPLLCEQSFDQSLEPDILKQDETVLVSRDTEYERGEDVNGLEKEEYILEPGIDCIIKISDVVNERENKDFVIDRLELQAFPSISDTTDQSTLTSVSDFSFTTNYDSSQTDSIFVYGDSKHSLESKGECYKSGESDLQKDLITDDNISNNLVVCDQKSSDGINEKSLNQERKYALEMTHDVCECSQVILNIEKDSIPDKVKEMQCSVSEVETGQYTDTLYLGGIDEKGIHAPVRAKPEDIVKEPLLCEQSFDQSLEPDILKQDETVLVSRDTEYERGEDVNGLEKEEYILEPGIDCIIKISDVVNERENKDFVIDRLELQAFPSISDTTDQSTLTSVSDFSFTTNYDSSQTDSIFVYGDSKHSLESKGECYKSGESDLQKDLITDDNISNNLVVCDQKSSDGINEKSLNQERKYALEMTHDVCECSQVILNIEKDSIPDKVKEMQCSVSEVETGQYTDTLYLGGIDEKGIHAPVRAKPEDIVKEPLLCEQSFDQSLEPDILKQDETVLVSRDTEYERGEDVNGLEKEEYILEPGIDCIIKISDVVNERENKDFVIDRLELQAFPSISDTTDQSTLTSVSDFSFTTNYDSSQTDSIFVYGDSKHSLESKGECYKSGESDLQKDLITDDNISNNLVVCDQKSSDGINEKSLNQERKYALEMTHDVCECSQVILNIEKDSIPDKVKEMQCSVSEVETGQYTDTLYLGGIDEKGIHAPVRAKPEDIVKEPLLCEQSFDQSLEPDILKQDETVLVSRDTEYERGEDVNGLEKEEYILEPGIDCIIKISDVVNERENKDFVIDRLELQAFPSISDTTDQSTLTSVSDFSFTTNYDSSQTDSIFVYEDSKHSLESKGECYKSGESDLQKDLITDDNISNNLVVCDQKSSDGINEKSLNQERKDALEMTQDVCEYSQVILNIEKDSIPDKVKEMQCSVSEVATGQYPDTLYLRGIDEKGMYAPVRAKPEDIVKEPLLCEQNVQLLKSNLLNEFKLPPDDESNTLCSFNEHAGQKIITDDMVDKILAMEMNYSAEELSLLASEGQQDNLKLALAMGITKHSGNGSKSPCSKQENKDQDVIVVLDPYSNRQNLCFSRNEQSAIEQKVGTHFIDNTLVSECMMTNKVLHFLNIAGDAVKTAFDKVEDVLENLMETSEEGSCAEHDCIIEDNKGTADIKFAMMTENGAVEYKTASILLVNDKRQLDEQFIAQDMDFDEAIGCKDTKDVQVSEKLLHSDNKPVNLTEILNFQICDCKGRLIVHSETVLKDTCSVLYDASTCIANSCESRPSVGHASHYDETDENNKKSTENCMQENELKYEESTTAQPGNISKGLHDAEEESKECQKTITAPLEDNPKDFCEVEEVPLDNSQQITADLPEGDNKEVHNAEEVLFSVRNQL